MNMDTGNKNNVLAFIGSYADSSTPGIYACRFDTETGSLEMVDDVSGLQNPTFLDVDEGDQKLYAITEGAAPEGQRYGAAAAYAIRPATGELSLINKEMTVSASTCHINLDRTRQCFMVASYHGGMIGLSPLLEDGRIGETADVHQHEGSSILPVQDRPRPHSVFFDRSNRFAVVCDLGLDRIVSYRLDVPARKLTPQAEVHVAPGAGPRHFAFHPSLSCGYVINELNATVTGFAYDEEQGSLTEIQTITTLPDSYQGENACADIHISPDGKFLYGSNRGHDSIVVYAIDPANGMLALVEHSPTLGGHPRNFALSPDGRFLLAANRDSNNIVTFTRDANTGKLQPTGSVLEVSKPVCIKFASFA
jgi:6-phosphogluconolactonase